MEDFPETPDVVIDPRWNGYLHPDAGLSPAHHPDDAGSSAAPWHEIIEPWQRGLRGTREPLEALRQLANRAL